MHDMACGRYISLRDGRGQSRTACETALSTSMGEVGQDCAQFDTFAASWLNLCSSCPNCIVAAPTYVYGVGIMTLPISAKPTAAAIIHTAKAKAKARAKPGPITTSLPSDLRRLRDTGVPIGGRIMSGARKVGDVWTSYPYYKFNGIKKSQIDSIAAYLGKCACQERRVWWDLLISTTPSSYVTRIIRKYQRLTITFAEARREL